MGFLGDIGKIIGDIIEGVFKGIKEIVEEIFNLVKEIVDAILDAIQKFVEAIINFISENVYVVLGIAFIVVAVSVAYYYATLYIPQFQAWVFSNPTAFKVYMYIATIKNYTVYVINAIRIRIANFILPILTKVKPFLSRVITRFRTVISWIKAGLNFVRGTILGRIYAKLQGIANFLFSIRLFAEIYRAFRNKKYAKGIWTLLKAIDEKTTREIEESTKAILNTVYEIRNEILDVIDGIQRDIRYIDSKFFYLEDTFKKLYEVFGVKVFGDISREISRLRRGMLESVDEYLFTAESKVYRVFRKLNEPFVNFMRIFREVERLIEEENALAKAFAYNPYRDGFIGYRRTTSFTIYVPKVIRRYLNY